MSSKKQDNSIAVAKITLIGTIIVAFISLIGNLILGYWQLKPNTATEPPLTPVSMTGIQQISTTVSSPQPTITMTRVLNMPAPTDNSASESETLNLSIMKGVAIELFDRQLVITIYDYSWSKKKTTFGISTPGFPEEVHIDQTIMDRSSYTQNGTFEVVVTGFPGSSGGPELAVTRLQTPSIPLPQSQHVSACKNETTSVFDNSLILGGTTVTSDTNLVSFEVFAPGHNTQQVENQPAGKKFTYQGVGNYEIQIMDVSPQSECVGFAVRRLK